MVLFVCLKHSRKRRDRMKRKFWNWVRNENDESRTLFLNGEISDETWYGDEVTPKLFKEELQSGEGDILPRFAILL